MRIAAGEPLGFGQSPRDRFFDGRAAIGFERREARGDGRIGSEWIGAQGEKLEEV